MQAIKKPRVRTQLTSLLFCEAFAFSQMISKIASGEQIHYEVEILLILECVAHVHQIWMFELGEEFTFVHH